MQSPQTMYTVQEGFGPHLAGLGGLQQAEGSGYETSI